ncbi:hypothetical protein Taro_015508 [Colocasia esculenta]|uniref:Uncharacterized protein n=1 Tax=Colocasia esculenta TaxID=4460 RepID=A0A843UBL2_COLES|nr:hypothetical protein [Colocasia esculenta]
MPNFRELGPESLKVPGMGLQVLCTGLVERQLDLPSVAARLRGSPVLFVQRQVVSGIYSFISCYIVL